MSRKSSVLVVLALMLMGLVAFTLLRPRLLTSVPDEPTPTPTPNLALGTQSPDAANQGFPSPAPKMPLPTDLAPDLPLDQKVVLLFRAPDGEGLLTFLLPYEDAEAQVEKIGVDNLLGKYPSDILLPTGPDREAEALQTAVATVTAAPTK